MSLIIPLHHRPPTEKIKQPTGMGDILPVYIRGKWVYTSYCQDFRDYVDGRTPGFTSSQLAKLGLLEKWEGTLPYGRFC